MGGLQGSQAKALAVLHVLCLAQQACMVTSMFGGFSRFQEREGASKLILTSGGGLAFFGFVKDGARRGQSLLFSGLCVLHGYLQGTFGIRAHRTRGKGSVQADGKITLVLSTAELESRCLALLTL